MPQPRSEPPPEFAFLSGIHPDLDDALCQHQSQRNSQSKRGNHLHSDHDHHLDHHHDIRNHAYNSNSHDRPQGSDDCFDFDPSGNADFRADVDVDVDIDGRSRSNSNNDDSNGDCNNSTPKEILCRPNSSTYTHQQHSRHRHQNSQQYQQQQQLLNETFESLPFSVDAMEQAKLKIKNQATRIRDLEERLQRKISSEISSCAASSSVDTVTCATTAATSTTKSSTSKKKSRINTGTGTGTGTDTDTNTNTKAINSKAGLHSNSNTSAKKVLSKEERLEAHKERKKLENQYMEKKGKWDTTFKSPSASLPSSQHKKASASEFASAHVSQKSSEKASASSFSPSSKKSKKKDHDLVDRLTLDPQARRRYEEVKRKTSRSMRDIQYDEEGSEHEDDYHSSPSSPLVRRQTLEEELMELSSSPTLEKEKRKKKKGRHSLMQRLKSGVEERMEDVDSKQNIGRSDDFRASGSRSSFERKGEDTGVLEAARRATISRKTRNGHKEKNGKPNDSLELSSTPSTSRKQLKGLSLEPSGRAADYDNGRERQRNESYRGYIPKSDSSNLGSLIDIPRCQTCGSTRDCEEDADDPNVYYCSVCWDEYENGSSRDQGFVESADSNEHDGRNSGGQEIKDTLTIHDMPQPSSQDFHDEAIWITHEDPKLASRLVCSGPKKMSCLIETKDPSIKNCVRIIHSSIDYSGPVVHGGGRSIRGSGSIQQMDRGAECIRLSNLWGFKVRHDKVQTKLSQNKSVHQFQLNKNDAVKLTGSNSQMAAKEFLKGCSGAVDVILDPQCSPGGWYPIREANGSRKIAPQFRSRGIGYIRLGDDMGNNGQAFMSDDDCQTFLFNESVQDGLNNDLLKTVSSFSSKPSYQSSRSTQSHKSQIQRYQRKQRDSRSDTTASKVSLYEGGLSEEDDDSSISSRSSQSEKINAGEILKDLQNMEGSKDMKWKDKADLLIKLGKAVSKSDGRSWCEGALNYIQDIISAKNINVHVLRSALLVVDKVGHVLEDTLPNHVAWRTIMIEILRLLKNKQCGGGARDILQKLHGKCFTLSKSLNSISHVLGINKTLSSSQKKINVRKAKANANARSQSQSQVSATKVKANNVEIIEWLAVTTEAERMLDKIDPAMDESELELLATFFLSHESHRDARCRKNALDGLLHTMLYGVDVLEMSVTEVQSLCMELKTVKPKSWARLMKSLKMVLQQPRR